MDQIGFAALSDATASFKSSHKDMRSVRSAVDERSADFPNFQRLPTGTWAPGETSLQFSVRRARNLRELRRTVFGEQNSSGPAWDLLLHLFDAHLAQRSETIGNVCIGACLAESTGLRWVVRLEQQGLVRSSRDHLDARRRYVALTEGGASNMTKYFSGVAPHLIAA